MKGALLFFLTSYHENFVLMDLLDPQIIRSNAFVRYVVLICLILYGFVVIIVNQVNEVGPVSRVRFE